MKEKDYRVYVFLAKWNEVWNGVFTIWCFSPRMIVYIEWLKVDFYCTCVYWGIIVHKSMWFYWLSNNCYSQNRQKRQQKKIKEIQLIKGDNCFNCLEQRTDIKLWMFMSKVL